MPSIRCPNCYKKAQRITQTRQHRGGVSIKRRRECLYCGWRFTTTEHVATETRRGPYPPKKRPESQGATRGAESAMTGTASATKPRHEWNITPLNL